LSCGVAAWFFLANRSPARALLAASLPTELLLPDRQKAPAGYAGSESCRECHPQQYKLWATSGHALAERPVQTDRDRPAFETARSFEHASQTSHVRLQEGQCQVVTLGFGNSLRPYRVERVIGHEPLRLFLVSAPGGRWQALELAYDPGADEWFALYGGQDRRPGEFGHWTGRGMNWNSRCADCHNTGLRKNYHEATDTYRTTMVEMGVGCEACHGPLKAHGDWRKASPETTMPDPRPPVVQRSQTMDVCGACHSRRDVLTGEFNPGDSFFDHFSLEILDEAGRWYADGQVRDEDYEFASFLGSRMFQGGVHCRDCHRADSGTGNALCMRCHGGGRPGFPRAPVVEPAGHGHHRLDDKGGECAGCHMPVTVYMQRHPRHDHAFTIPDPLLTKELNIPNACTRCHADRTVDWALEYTERWYGARMQRHTRERARWIAAALRSADSAKARLMSMLTGTNEPPYWRAVAANLLWRWAGEPAVRNVLLAGLKDEHPLVREKAARSLEPLLRERNAETIAALRALLEDPVRSVRVAAAWITRTTLDPRSRAGRELETALRLDADQPLGRYRWAILELSRNGLPEALAHLREAVEWDPYSPPFRCKLAEVLDQTGRLEEALLTLTQAEALVPDDPHIPCTKATILMRNGRNREARAAVNQALQIQRDFQPALELVQRLPGN
jgi:Flp pilus assembly protein TadD